MLQGGGLKKTPDPVPPMFTPAEIVDVLEDLVVTHVVWLPDSELGAWEAALEANPLITLVRVAREGEAWPLAAGLCLGGRRSVVVMQTTGFFESGDALRNVLFDLGLPLYAIIGHRGYLVPDSRDTARRFAEPILAAWGIDYVLIGGPQDKPRLVEHFRACQAAGKPGVALVAEGRM
jgi:sulfopyruvate decarboxylase TPP-binding subunit